MSYHYNEWYFGKIRTKRSCSYEKYIAFVLAAIYIIGLVECNDSDAGNVLKLNHKLNISDEYLTQNQETTYQNTDIAITTEETE